MLKLNTNTDFFKTVLARGHRHTLKANQFYEKSLTIFLSKELFKVVIVLNQ